VTFRNFSTSAARVCWALAYGEWTKRNAFFKDGDQGNLKLVNLELRGETVERDENGCSTRKMKKSYSRKYGLKRYYDMLDEEYDAGSRLQGGVCEICRRPPRGKTVGQGGAIARRSRSHHWTYSRSSLHELQQRPRCLHR
jgi:hypothetical protein